MRIALLAPHFFMNNEIFEDVIFSPGHLVINLAIALKDLGHEVTLVSPGFTLPEVKNLNTDLTLFHEELRLRGYGFMGLFKKHPLTFITLARQVQSELVSKCYEAANKGQFDIVHVFMNEEEIPLVFARFCKTKIVFTHHEPFNYLAKYRSFFPKYKDLNWISISQAQRSSLPEANFIGNVYNGIPENQFQPNLTTSEEYLAYCGRIIEPKGVHLAIKAAKKAGMKLKIAGKHYSDGTKDKYWQEKIQNELNENIEFIGFLKTNEAKQNLLGNAKALLMASTWEEPFGVAMIEAMACGTPVIGLNSGAIPEVIVSGKNGFIVDKVYIPNQEVLDEEKIIDDFVSKIDQISQVSRKEVRDYFTSNFTSAKMARDYAEIYQSI